MLGGGVYPKNGIYIYYIYIHIKKRTYVSDIYIYIYIQYLLLSFGGMYIYYGQGKKNSCFFEDMTFEFGIPSLHI